MRTLLLLLLFGCMVQGFAQEQPPGRPATVADLEPLRKQLGAVKTDTAKLNLLLDLGRSFMHLSWPDSMLQYANQAAELAKNLQRPAGQSTASMLIVWAYRYTGRYPEALQTAFANLQRMEATQDSFMILPALRQVMFVCSDLQEHSQILAHARRAQKLVHTAALPPGVNPYRIMLNGYLNFLSGAFEGLHQYDSALHYRKMAFGLAQRLNDQQQLALTTEGIGGIYFAQKKYDSAAAYYSACLQHVKQAGFRNDLTAKAALALAKIYQLQQQPAVALPFAQQALTVAHNSKILTTQAAAAALLHSLYAARTNKDSAYKYLLLSTTLRDSLVNEEKIKKTEQVKYADALERQRAAQALQESAAQYKRRLRTIALTAGAAMVVWAAFLFYRFRILRKEEQMKAAFAKQLQETELRALKAQMNPHFVFNCLNSINRYIVKADTATASEYLSKFARLIRFILDNAAAETVSLDKEIETLRLYLDMEALRFEDRFEHAIEVDETLLAQTLAIPPMLVQPFVENAIWHGLLHKEAGNGGWVRVRFMKTDAQTVVAEIEDNGVGRSKANELKSKDALRKKSYGMKITDDRIRLLNELSGSSAKVQVTDLFNQYGEGCGTLVTITMPARSIHYSNTLTASTP